VSGTGHFCFKPKIQAIEKAQIWQKYDDVMNERLIKFCAFLYFYIILI